MPNKSESAKKKNSAFSPSILVALAVILVTVVGLTMAIIKLGGSENSADTSSAVSGVENIEVSYTSVSVPEEGTLKGTYYAEILMEDGGQILMELYADSAPITVTNFVKLVQDEFYDELIFHRVIEGFMIQGGDPKGDGTGGSAETIFGEFTNNGFENNLSHTRGVVSMARKGNPYRDSASSQFFICHGDSTYLDGEYAAFGKVISGMDVVDKIAAVKTNAANNKPLEDVVIKSIRMIEKPAA